MEELQDAIEDAQYVNAIATQEDGPRPVLPWDKPSDDELLAWEESASKEKLELDWICSSAIGLFLFSSFVKQQCDDYVRINFCEEVLRFKRLRGRASRLEKAEWIVRQYLYKLVEPPRTEIDEYDLERPLPAKQRQQSNMTTAEIDKQMQVNMDYPECSECCVGLKGPVRAELLAKIREHNVMDRTIGERNESMHGSGMMAMSTSIRISEQQQQQQQQQLQEESPAAGNDDHKDNDNNDKGVITGNHVDNNTPSIHSADNEETDCSARQDAAVDDDNDDDDEGQTTNKDKTIIKRGMMEQSHAASMHELRNATTYRALTQRLRSSNTNSGSTTTTTRGSLSNVGSLDSTIFDVAERIVMESLRRQYWQAFTESEDYYVKLKHFLWYQDRRVVPDDFFVMRVLGRGGFGLVTACKKGTSGKLYAMKVMNKRRIKMKKSEQLALNERQALAAVESNFVVNLKYSFHSKDDVFLILDLMTGGDLGYHLHQKGRFPKRECQYYAARIMLGLQALHDKQYVYRDLKPENCLLADDGRVKITDLGLATKITPTLHGAAGTRGYWAPEMLRRDKKGRRMPYSHTVDWFSFGCCLAEFISGTNPFRSEAALNFGLERGKQTKEKAIDCATLEMDPEFNPEKFEPDAADLCRRLLDKNENTRLGFTGCEEIMAHPWFKNVNWEAIISDRKRPPFVPLKDVNAASQSEIGTFAEDKAYQETVITEADEEVYKDWDWTNPRAFAAEVVEFLIYERETGEPLVPVTQHGSCCCVIL